MNLKYFRILIISIFILNMNVLWAMDSMRVLRISTSGNTIILNRGHLEGIKHGDKGRLVHQEGLDKPKLSYVAEAEAIKVYDKYSFWILSNIDNGQLVVEGQKLLFARIEDVMKQS